MSIEKSVTVRGITFSETGRTSVPFMFSSDLCIGYSKKEDDYKEFIRRFNYEICEKKTEVVSYSKEKAIKLQSRWNRSYHLFISFSKFDDVPLSNIRVGPNLPAIIMVEEGYFLVTPVRDPGNHFEN